MSDTISVQVLNGGDTIHAGVVEVVDRSAVVAEALALAEAYADTLFESATAGPMLQAARAVATSNYAGAYPFTGLPSADDADGITLAEGDVFLLTAQTAASRNGPWIVSAGAWSRPTDYAGAIPSGKTVEVLAGDVNALTTWEVTGSGTVDTNTTTWTRLHSTLLTTTSEAVRVPPDAKVLHVTKSGDDSNDGRSWASAFLTVGAASTALDGTPGIIHVGAGTFNEINLCPPKGSVVNGVGRGSPAQDLPATVINLATDGGTLLASPSGTTWRSLALTFDDAVTSGWLVDLENMFNNHFEDVVFSGGWDADDHDTNLEQVGVKLGANAGDNTFLNFVFTGLGIGVDIYSETNNFSHGKFADCATHVRGGDATGVAFSAGAAFTHVTWSGTGDYYVNLEGSSQSWHFGVGCWYDGNATTAVQIGNANGGPALVSLTDIPNLAGDVNGLVVTRCVFTVLGSIRFGTGTPTPLSIDPTNAPSGFAYGLRGSDAGGSFAFAQSDFPAAWTYIPRGGGRLFGISGPWQASTALPAYSVFVLPTGGLAYLTSRRTTRASFDATERAFWTFLPGGHYEKLTSAWTVPAGITQLRYKLIGVGGPGVGGGAAALTGGVTSQVGGPGGGAAQRVDGELVGLTPGDVSTTTIPAAPSGGPGAAASTGATGNSGGIGTYGSDVVFTVSGKTVKAHAGGRGSSAAANSTSTAFGGAQGTSLNGAALAVVPGNGGYASSTVGQGAAPASEVIGGGGGAPASATLGGNAGNALTSAGGTVGQATGNTATADGATGATATEPGCGGGGGGGGAPGGKGGDGGAGGPGQIEIWF